ncbi:MAG: hypothetical protein WC369_07085 [Dehalococcoidales bacterium]
MRIIPDDTKDTLLHFGGDYVDPSNHYKTGTPIYFKADTIELTDSELDEIWRTWSDYCIGFPYAKGLCGNIYGKPAPFSEWFKWLIELKRGKMNAQ